MAQSNYTVLLIINFNLIPISKHWPPLCERYSKTMLNEEKGILKLLHTYIKTKSWWPFLDNSYLILTRVTKVIIAYDFVSFKSYIQEIKYTVSKIWYHQNQNHIHLLIIIPSWFLIFCNAANIILSFLQAATNKLF